MTELMILARCSIAIQSRMLELAHMPYCDLELDTAYAYCHRVLLHIKRRMNELYGEEAT